MIRESSSLKNQELKLNSWTISVEEDAETGDLILPLPQDLLEQAGWKEGDTLEWQDRGDGSWSLLKKSV